MGKRGGGGFRGGGKAGGGGAGGGRGGGGRGGGKPFPFGGGNAARAGFAMPGPGLEGIKKKKKAKDQNGGQHGGGAGRPMQQQQQQQKEHQKRHQDPGFQPGGGGSAKKKPLGDGPSVKRDQGAKEGGGGAGGGAPFVSLSREVLQPGADSRDVSMRLFELMIHPITAEEFYRDYFEKKPLLIRRKNRRYYDDWMRMTHVRKLIDSDELEWTYEVDVTSYVGGQRQTHNCEGLASKEEIWRRHKEEGCSVRLLRPQKRLDHMCLLLSLLDEHWGSGAGANVYLTPAGHQGFAPHWDDIEAFVLQTEGSKNWRVYAPRNEAEEMPRFSSRNFDQSEVGQPIMECEVHAGDMLYFPRGFIHQAVVNQGGEKHSLHVTVSFGYRNSWYDYLKSTMEAALEDARKEDIRLRRSMPRDYLSYMGGMYAGSGDDRRAKVKKQVKELLSSVVSKVTEGAMDAGADDRARTLLKERLPICLGPTGKGGQGADREEMLEEERGERAGLVDEKSKIRVVRAGVARLHGEGAVVVLYNCVDNSREYHGAEEQGLDFDPIYSQALQQLLVGYPKYTSVGKLEGDLDMDEKVELAQVLVANGIAEVKE